MEAEESGLHSPVPILLSICLFRHAATLWRPLMKRSHSHRLIILLLSGLLLASPGLVHAQQSKAQRPAAKTTTTSLSQAEALEDLDAFSKQLRESRPALNSTAPGPSKPSRA
jgi:hypothetical protein